MRSDSNIFGSSFRSSQKYATETLHHMLQNNIIDHSGMILPRKYPSINKSQLWGYVYLIIFQNKSKFPEIRSTITFRNDVKMMVVEFLKRSLDHTNMKKYVNNSDKLTYLTKAHLIMFVNTLVMMTKENYDLIDKLMLEEEEKIGTLIKDIEKSIYNPNLKIINNDEVKEVRLKLRQKRVDP